MYSLSRRQRLRRGKETSIECITNKRFKSIYFDTVELTLFWKTEMVKHTIEIYLNPFSDTYAHLTFASIQGNFTFITWSQSNNL